MSVYLDASVLVSLFAIDSLSARADSALRARTAVLIVSDFAAAEFASAIARRVRMKFLMRDEARAAFSTFDAWLARTASLAAVTSEDVLMAAAFLRRLDLTLRTQDAVHIAMAQRLDADLLTFDKQMAAGAKVLGTKLFRG